MRQPILFLLILSLLGVPIVPARASRVGESANVKPVDEHLPPPTTEADPNASMGNEIKHFGEQVANRVDRIIKKKGFDLYGDPWLFQGIPIIFPSPSIGFNLGLKVQLQNIRRQDPHKMEIEATVLASDKGRYKHSFGIDYPRAFGGLYRITAKLGYDRDISLRYFGMGNNPPIDRAALENPDSILYQNVREGPTISLQALRYLGHHFRAGPILGLKWTSIAFPTGGLLDIQRPIGSAGGKTHSIGVAIIHDTLDFEPYPSRGSYNELYVRVHLPLTGSDYSFVRYTYTYRRYLPLHPRLILAHRALFEYLSGDAPFYELSSVGGSNSQIGFGGDRYFRGYEADRFTDRFKVVFGFELRWNAFEFSFAKQDISIGFVPFFDIGRVFPTVVPFPIASYHASAGWGTRIIWNERFILRGDFAVTTEGSAFVINLGNSF